MATEYGNRRDNTRSNVSKVPKQMQNGMFSHSWLYENGIIELCEATFVGVCVRCVWFYFIFMFISIPHVPHIGHKWIFRLNKRKRLRASDIWFQYGRVGCLLMLNDTHTLYFTKALLHPMHTHPQILLVRTHFFFGRELEIPILCAGSSATDGNMLSQIFTRA